MLHKKGMDSVSEEVIDVNEEKPSLFGIITNPTLQFERIRKQPIFWGALVIVTLISIIGLWLTSLGVEIPELEELSAEEVAVGKVVGVISIALLAIINTVVSILFSTALYLLIAKVNRSQVTFKQLFSMHTYIMLMTSLNIAVNGFISFLLGDNYADRNALFTSLGAFINVEGPIGVLLNHIEVFGIWILILTVIGLQKVAQFSKTQAWIVVLVFFFVNIIFSMTSAEASGLIN